MFRQKIKCSREPVNIPELLSSFLGAVEWCILSIQYVPLGTTKTYTLHCILNTYFNILYNIIIIYIGGVGDICCTGVGDICCIAGVGDIYCIAGVGDIRCTRDVNAEISFSF